MPIKAQSILLIPNKTTDLGVLQSTIVLAQTFRNQNQNFAIYSEGDYPEEFSPFPKYDITKSGELTLNLTKVEDTVSNVNWRQSEDSVEIRLSTVNGKLGNPTVELIKNDNSFDLRIFIGFNKKEAKLIDIAEDGKINKAKSVYFTEDEDNEVIPVQVFNYLKKHKLKLTEHSALNLLEGLYKATKNFTRKQSAEGFFIASKLMTIIQDNIQPDIGEPVKTQDETTLEKTDQTKESSPNIEQPKKEEEILVDTQKEDDKEDDDQIVLPESENKEEYRKESVQEVKEPEVLPPDYDPLAPATEVPEPLILDNDAPKIKPIDNSPLPGANS